MQQRGWLAVREKRESYAGWRRRKERKEEGKKEKEICSQLRVKQPGNIFAYIETEKGKGESPSLNMRCLFRKELCDYDTY